MTSKGSKKSKNVNNVTCAAGSVAADGKASDDIIVDQGMVFNLNEHKGKLIRAQMGLCNLRKEFTLLRGLQDIGFESLNAIETKLVSLEENICQLCMITLENAEICGKDVEVRAENLLDDVRVQSRSCNALLDTLIQPAEPVLSNLVNRSDHDLKAQPRHESEGIRPIGEKGPNNTKTLNASTEVEVPERSVKNSTLNPLANVYVNNSPTARYNAPPVHYRGSSIEWNVAGGNQAGFPGPRLNLDSFDGDILKYFPFKRKFVKLIEEVYLDYDIRFSFLEDACKGKAHQLIAGLSCLEDREQAYNMAWLRLDKRFGDQNKLMSRVRQDILEGPPIKEWDAQALLELCNKMYKCETGFYGWISLVY